MQRERDNLPEGFFSSKGEIEPSNPDQTFNNTAVIMRNDYINIENST